MTLLLVIVLPFAAAVVSLLARPRWIAPAVTVLATFAAGVIALTIAFRVAGGAHVDAIAGWVECDGLSAVMLVLVAWVGLLAALFSWGYMRRDAHASPGRQRTYYWHLNLFIGSLLTVPALVEPALVWIAVELTALFSVLLVSFDDTHEALEAAWKYAVLTITGGMVALVGFLMLFWALRAGGDHVFTWAALSAAAPHLRPEVLGISFALILVGFGTKVGFVPLHTWLPDAHSQAPSPVCALLSGVKTAIVLYVILRLLPVVGAVFEVHATTWLIWIGLVSVGVAAFLLTQVRDYKRMFAFSTVEHMGIILVAAGLGTTAGRYGAVYQILAHGITKSFSFLAAGAVLLLYGTREIADVRGLLTRSPLAAVALLVAGLAIAGAPPFPIFLSELTIFRAGLDAGHPAVVALLGVFIVVAFIGVMLQTNRLVFSAPNGYHSAERLPSICAATLVLAVVPILVCGIYTPPVLDRLLQMAAAAIVR
jgi:hydrogenase-4 component F